MFRFDLIACTLKCWVIRDMKKKKKTSRATVKFISSNNKFDNIYEASILREMLTNMLSNLKKKWWLSFKAISVLSSVSPFRVNFCLYWFCSSFVRSKRGYWFWSNLLCEHIFGLTSKNFSTTQNYGVAALRLNKDPNKIYFPSSP